MNNEQTERKSFSTTAEFSDIGLTNEEYGLAVNSLRSRDIEVLQDLASRSANRLKDISQIPPSPPYSVERLQLHQQLVQDALAEHLPQSDPVITFLAGPPGVGKSLLKPHFIDPLTTVETDPDDLRHKLMPDYDNTSPESVTVTQNEAMDVAQKILDAALERSLSVVCETTLRDINWIRQTCSKAKLNGYQTSLIFLHKPFDICFSDAFERGERPVSLPFLLSCVQGYVNLAQLTEEQSFNSISLYDTTDAKSGTIRPINSIYEIVGYAQNFLPAASK